MPAAQDYPHWKSSNHFPIAIAITIDKMTLGAPQNHWLSLSISKQMLDDFGVPEIGASESFAENPFDKPFGWHSRFSDTFPTSISITISPRYYYDIT